MVEENFTPFQIIYNRFMSKITDDMYLELTEEETYRDLKNILLNSLGNFEFPRFPLYDYNEEVEFLDTDGKVAHSGIFNSNLTHEEVDILANLMVAEWVKRQISSVENTRMKYSGSDFKFTSQANHIDKLLKMKKDYEYGNKKQQRLYKRRKLGSNGMITTNWSGMAGGVIKNGSNG